MANIIHNLSIDADLQKVYEAITTESGLRGWWTTATTAKPKEGFINHFRFGPVYFNKMKVTRLSAPTAVHWQCVDGDHEWIGTTISFILEKREEATFLKFSHKHWAEESEFFGVCTFHWGRFLVSLKSFCETGKGEPYAHVNNE